MTLTTLDPVPALVVIDLQKAITDRVPPEVGEPAVAHAAELARSFRAHRLPVVLVTVAGTAPGRTDADRSAPPAGSHPPDWGDVVPALEPHPDDLRVTKRTWGAFTGTDLDAQLRERGVTQVLLAGIATSAGVESTARSAHELGYHVVPVLDAMADRDPVLHQHSVQRILPRLGETAVTSEVLSAVDGRS